MKNILNVNKISLKPIFMSLAILLALGIGFSHSSLASFEKSAGALNQSSQTPNFDDLGGNSNKKLSCKECLTMPLEKISNLFSSNKENPTPNTEIIIEEEEEVPDEEDNNLNNDGITHRTPSSQGVVH